MTAAFQRYDEEAATRRCDQVLEFDRAQSNPERIDALLGKGMIMHKRDPKRAEQYYLECLNFGDADLIPVVLNNLGVICLEPDKIQDRCVFLGYGEFWSSALAETARQSIDSVEALKIPGSRDVIMMQLAQGIKLSKFHLKS